MPPVSLRVMLAPATPAELPEVAALVNATYRGEASRQGWTNEADFLDGERTDVASLRADLAAKPDAKLLVMRDEPGGELLGCLWLEPAGGAAWYLGLLTVRPTQQDRQLGRGMLAEAEILAKEAGARRIRMTVISIRDTLIAWYRRRGYEPTGETLPFPYVDRSDLSFVVLEKAI